MREPESPRNRTFARLAANADVIAIGLALAADLAVTLTSLYYARIWRIEVALAIACICAAATLMLPRQAHRRWLPLAIALLALPAIGYFNPRVGLAGLVLVVVLEIRCTLAFGLRGSAIVGVFGALMLVIGVSQQKLPAHGAVLGLLAVALLFAAFFGILALLANSLRSERAGRRELEDAHRQLRTYAERAAEMAMIEERSRVALDLHDALGHGLTTLSVELQSAARLRGNDDAKADAFVNLANATALSLLTDLRETVGILRRNRRASEPFSTLMTNLFTDFSQMGTLDFTWSVNVANEPDGATGLMLLRVAQEALTNVARHAGATHLQATVIGDAAQITVTIEDDGRGFSPASTSDGTGLSSMRERLSSLGGHVRIDSTESGGTTVHAIAPLGSG
jgi:signal transduction histidine kinase